VGRQVENNTREIDGMTVEVFLLPPTHALKVLTRLSKIVGEPLGLAAGALLGDKPEESRGDAEAPPASALQKDIPDAVIGKVLAAFTDRLDEGVVLDTLKLVLANVFVKTDGDAGTRKVNLEQDFLGKTLTMLKVFAFALEVNFSDFFAGASGSGAILKKAKAAMARATT
jgi:hypothetical protein